jgi:hypothetical protein
MAWQLAFTLVAALIAGFAAGWSLFLWLHVRPANVWISMLVLLAGSVGGPAVTFHTLGPGRLSFAIAVCIAGFAAGATFWPMVKPQGTREWL